MSKISDSLRGVRFFLMEVRNELKKSTWPTRNELLEFGEIGFEIGGGALLHWLCLNPLNRRGRGHCTEVGQAGQCGRGRQVSLLAND